MWGPIGKRGTGRSVCFKNGWSRPRGARKGRLDSKRHAAGDSKGLLRIALRTKGRGGRSQSYGANELASPSVKVMLAVRRYAADWLRAALAEKLWCLRSIMGAR